MTASATAQARGNGQGESAEGVMRNARHAVEDEARNLAERGVGSATAYLDDLSDSIGSSAETLRRKGHARTAEAFDTMTGRISGVSQHLHDQSLNGLLDEVSDFAHRQPAVFFGLAFLAGFGAARFMKASERDQ